MISMYRKGEVLVSTVSRGGLKRERLVQMNPLVCDSSTRLFDSLCSFVGPTESFIYFFVKK